jgi:hypothetical protein
MGARWQQENHFRYAHIRFDLDSHDSYAAATGYPGTDLTLHYRVKTGT